MYGVLARKGLVEKDRHQGYHFRKFLHQLKDANVLGQVIPQCTFSINDRGESEWRFHLSVKKANNAPDTGKTATTIHKPAMSKAEIQRLVQEESPNVEKLPVRTDKVYTPQEMSIKKNYTRAYEIWTNNEYMILDRVYKQCRNIEAVAGLLKRQPHIVKEKLEAKRLIE